MKRIRRFLPVIMAIGVAASSGCVYWRLLQFKRQLDRFNEHFEFRSDSVYTLVAREPLLSGEDIDEIMEVEPTRRERDAELDWRVYAFQQVPNGRAPLDYRMGFRDGVLVELQFPAQFTDLYPEAAIRELLESLGRAEVERETASTRSSLRRRLCDQLPDSVKVESALGPPSERDFDIRQGARRWLYRYRILTPTTGKKEEKRRAWGCFWFGEDAALVRVDAGIGRHELRFDIPMEPEAADGDAAGKGGTIDRSRFDPRRK
jgi:hypothetical protein